MVVSIDGHEDFGIMRTESLSLNHEPSSPFMVAPLPFYLWGVMRPRSFQTTAVGPRAPCAPCKSTENGLIQRLHQPPWNRRTRPGWHLPGGISHALWHLSTALSHTSCAASPVHRCGSRMRGQLEYKVAPAACIYEMEGVRVIHHSAAFGKKMDKNIKYLWREVRAPSY